MKYIRTKDNKIYELRETKNKEKYLVRTNELIPLWNTNEYEVLKEADTIEELVDELVIHNPSNDGDFYPKHFVYKNKWETMLKPISDYQKSKGIEVYGAIWTDKGLIYVAKMNEKGVLELL